MVIRPKRADLTSPKNALPEDMEAYIRALMGKEIVQGGSSLTKGEKLQWTYSLNLKRKTNETDISLELWYKDNFSGNYLKGKINIDLLKTNVFLDAKPEIWFDIRNEDDEIIGKMLIGLEWKVISLKKKNN